MSACGTKCVCTHNGVCVYGWVCESMGVRVSVLGKNTKENVMSKRVQ